MLMRTAIMTKVFRRPRISTLGSLGWTARMMMAQMSWKMRMPTVRRPGPESVSAFSDSCFTTIIVEEMPQVAPTYIVAIVPPPKVSPKADSQPMKMATITPAQRGNWTRPVTITTGPILKSSLTSSSSPIMKSRKMRPSELSEAISAWSLMMFRPILDPMSTPPMRYPRMRGWLSRFTTKATKPAAATEYIMSVSRMEGCAAVISIWSPSPLALASSTKTSPPNASR
mmetsp:Transcript_14087/g.41947  ORF Transcript_14087/g.41947 Transcript_14087/m.41947 type:complete len:227 (+) Transcript_14087:1326-2006(+)